LREAVRHFRARNGGIITSMSGWAAQRGSGNRSAFAYAASKAAIENLIQRITRTFAKHNISDFIMAPGPVHTQTRNICQSQGGKEKIFAPLAMGEWAEPTELLDLVAVLASGQARYLSGATLDFKARAISIN
jgi:NAD(P)-dependent dehydrogenase (short-subunit alcohol dehydrogenase family)